MINERIELIPGYNISRVIKGGWHLAGGHGQIDEKKAIEDMYAFVKAGITTFDCADIYTGVETLIGKFLHQYRDAFSDIDFGDLLQLQHLKGSTHLVTALNHQQQLLDDVDSFLRKHALLPEVEEKQAA